MGAAIRLITSDPVPLPNITGTSPTMVAIEVIITGRYADKKIMKAADLITEMREVKHYFNKGVQARVGIEK